MENVTTFEWITLGAIIVGPILAVQTQRLLESLRDNKNRRKTIFHTLMATRAARVSHEHVQALNMIDIEFYGRRRFSTQIQTKAEKKVTNAWKAYSDHLNKNASDVQLNIWFEEGDKLLAKLLFELSNALGYSFDEIDLRRNVYSPVAHGRQQVQSAAIRDGIEELLTNKRAIPVVICPPPNQPTPNEVKKDEAGKLQEE